MKIYTKTGDQGETGLFGGPRVRKDATRIEAYGTVDELNAVLGVVRAAEPSAEGDAVVERIQHELFVVGAELASPGDDQGGVPPIGPAHIEHLEATIDRCEESVAPLKQFILPGGTAAASHLHLARTVCRRAERRVVTLAGEVDLRNAANILAYLNRLSDLLFVLARFENQSADRADIVWRVDEPAKD